MTTLYRPVPITSAEQAEALPAHTAVSGIHPGGSGRFEVAFKDEGGDWWGSDCSIASNGDVVGLTALVPIEAEEEWGEDEDADTFTPTHRLVTAWELAGGGAV